jgi:hypothetical protein
MRTVAAISTIILLAGCNSAMETEKSPNGATAEMIATVDGCRIWRINDGRHVYFARCPEGAADIGYSYVISTGKVTTVSHVETIGDH